MFIRLKCISSYINKDYDIRELCEDTKTYTVTINTNNIIEIVHNLRRVIFIDGSYENLTDNSFHKLLKYIN